MVGAVGEQSVVNGCAADGAVGYISGMSCYFLFSLWWPLQVACVCYFAVQQYPINLGHPANCIRALHQPFSFTSTTVIGSHVCHVCGLHHDDR